MGGTDGATILISDPSGSENFQQSSNYHLLAGLSSDSGLVAGNYLPLTRQ
jgi:hypothetical protein